MDLKKDQIFVGLTFYPIDDPKWIFGCPDVKPNSFGFVPLNYLDYERKIERE